MKELPKSQINPVPAKKWYSDYLWDMKLGPEPIRMPEKLIQLEIDEPGTLEKLVFIISNAPGIIGAIFKLINLYFKFKELIMAENPKDAATNWVALVTGIVTTIFTILVAVGVVIPQNLQEVIISALAAIVGAAVTIIGYFTGKKSEPARIR